jgi:excisionase family DNA binding protein
MQGKTLEKQGAATVKDAAAYLSLSRATLYRLIESGEIKSVKIGGSRRIAWKILEALVTPRQ